MNSGTEATRLRIYLGEADRQHGRPVYELIVDAARQAGLAGATVFRGSMGFGAGAVLRTAKILALSNDLPIVVEIVDEPNRVEAFVESAKALLEHGMMTSEPVHVHFYQAGT